jgi:hypothetical protein
VKKKPSFPYLTKLMEACAKEADVYLDPDWETRRRTTYLRRLEQTASKLTPSQRKGVLGDPNVKYLSTKQTRELEEYLEECFGYPPYGP